MIKKCFYLLKKNSLIFSKEIKNKLLPTLKTPCVGLLTTHTTRQKSIENLKIFYFIDVQGENTIARR